MSDMSDLNVNHTAGVDVASSRRHRLQIEGKTTGGDSAEVKE